MTLEELYAYFGTWTQVSRGLALGTNSYQKWKKNGCIPYTTQLLIEKRSNGLFKADESHAKRKT